MRSELHRLRDEAEEAGKVSPSNNPWGIIKCFLDALVGDLNDAKKSDPAMGELAAAILPSCDRPSQLPLPPGAVTDDSSADTAEDADNCVVGNALCGVPRATAEGDPWEGEAPAEPSAPPTPLTTPNDPNTDSSQLPAAEQLPSSVAPEKNSPTPPTPSLRTPPSVSNPKSQISNLKSSPPLKSQISNPKSSPPRPLNPYSRLLLREQKLDDLKDHIKTGLPFMMEWDPELGPPPPLSHHLDDPGCSPSIQTKDDQSQMVRDYLEKLRAEQLANA